MTQQDRVRARPRVAQEFGAACLLLLAATAALPTGSAGRPVFTADIPDIGVIAGESNATAYDLLQSFTDPDGDSLEFSVMLIPWTCGRAGPLVAVSGSWLQVSSNNSSSGIICTSFAVTARDPAGGETTSREARAWVGPGPATNRTWVNDTRPEDGGAAGLEGGCYDRTYRMGWAVPSDTRFTEYDLVVGHGNPTRGSAGAGNWNVTDTEDGTAARLIALLGDTEVLNRSVPRSPERAYLDVALINQYIADHPSPFNVVQFRIDLSYCAWDGNYTIGNWGMVARYVRLPQGDSGDDLNSRGPSFSGSVRDLNLTAGGGTSAFLDLNSLFSDPDGDPLEFAVNLVSADGWQDGSVVFDLTAGILGVRALNASWTGNLTASVSARDPSGQRAAIPNFVVRILPGSVGATGPMLARPLLNASMYFGQVDVPLFDAGVHFADDKDSNPFFAVVNKETSAGWGFIQLQWRGSTLFASTMADQNATGTVWTGTLCFAVRARDANNLSLTSNEVCLSILDPATAPPIPKVAITVQGNMSLDAIPEDTPVAFALSSDEPLPPDLTIVWLLDGQKVGEGANLTALMPSPGAHHLDARLTYGVRTEVVSVSFSVGPRASPPAAGSMNGARWWLIGGAASAAIVGLMVARSERSRYLVLAMVVGSVFSTLKKPSPLDHFLRGRLYQEIQREPGVHFEELRRRTGIANGQASHHLRTLEKAGYVRVVPRSNRICFYPTDRALDSDYGLRAIDRTILELVSSRPGITQREMSTQLGRSATAISRSVSNLHSLGYVDTARSGRAVAVFPRETRGPEVASAAPWAEEGGS